MVIFLFGRSVGSGVEDGSTCLPVSYKKGWGEAGLYVVAQGQEQAEMRPETRWKSLGGGQSGTGYKLSGKDGISVKSLAETHMHIKHTVNPANLGLLTAVIWSSERMEVSYDG